MYVTGSVDVCGPVDLWIVDRITISCTQQEVWISVDLWTCGLWTGYLSHVCNGKSGPVDLWTRGPVDRISI